MNCLSVIGSSYEQECVDGKVRRRVYFDSAATALPFKGVEVRTRGFLDSYGSPHSRGSLASESSLEIEGWSKKQILDFLNAPESEYDVFFGGWGATGVINRIAAGLSEISDGGSSVIISPMEHHSNDLPHRHYANNFIHSTVSEKSGWNLCVEEYQALLEEGKYSYIAITAASNVTGIVTPYRQLAKLAHQHGAIVLVDGAQAYSHMPISLKGSDNDDIDIFVFSGHKAHAHSSPGIAVIKKEISEKMPPFLFGGGMVEEVSLYGFKVAENVGYRESAGTPNTFGIYGIGIATEILHEYGIHKLKSHEQDIKKYLITRLGSLPRILMYGEGDNQESLGVLSFNIKNIPHGVVGQALNDFFAISVRTGCFCAHPYVRELLVSDFFNFDTNSLDLEKYQGMVRISLGSHNTTSDVDCLVNAISWIIDNESYLIANYLFDNNVFYLQKAALPPCLNSA